MICDSLQELDVVYCLKLKRLPFSHALLKSIRKARRIQKNGGSMWNGTSAVQRTSINPLPDAVEREVT
ncbi:hypothetical protein Peur_023582 [Populus x canadensis]